MNTDAAEIDKQDYVIGNYIFDMLRLLIVVIKTFYIIFVISFPTIGENVSSLDV